MPRHVVHGGFKDRTVKTATFCGHIVEPERATVETSEITCKLCLRQPYRLELVTMKAKDITTYDILDVNGHLMRFVEIVRAHDERGHIIGVSGDAYRINNGASFDMMTFTFHPETLFDILRPIKVKKNEV